MKSLIIISLCVTAACAGVIKWTKDGEDEALSLWREYCSGNSDRGVDESRDVDWYCKRSPDGGREVNYPHKIDLGLTRQNKKQIVFVETPGDHYKHDITVSGHIEANLKTNIVVIPGKDTHEIDVKKDITVNSDGEKPAIFFVRNDPNGNHPNEEVDSSDGYPPPQQPAPAPPPGLYQVPPTEKTVSLRRVETRRTTS